MLNKFLTRISYFDTFGAESKAKFQNEGGTLISFRRILYNFTCLSLNSDIYKGSNWPNQ